MAESTDLEMTRIHEVTSVTDAFRRTVSAVTGVRVITEGPSKKADDGGDQQDLHAWRYNVKRPRIRVSGPHKETRHCIGIQSASVNYAKRYCQSIVRNVDRLL